jgi:RNA polymerase sigma-70 factor (ECF subfamily)
LTRFAVFGVLTVMDRVREPVGPSGVRSDETREPGRDPEALLEGIRRGDADAFEELARECAPRLFRLALSLTGRVEDAEDLVQETLVRSLPALRGFEGRAKLSTYLTRALQNLWKNRLRSRSRSPLVGWFRLGRGRKEELEDVDPQPAADGPDAQQRIEAEDRAERVREAVATLQPERRLTLLLREVEELSYEEIAAETGVPVGTVRSRLARAREDLRRVLGSEP